MQRFSMDVDDEDIFWLNKATSGGASSSDTYSVSLKRCGKACLGIAVEAVDSKLVVIDVLDGLVARWNAAHPHLAVRPGHVIRDVNGRRGSPKDLLRWMSEASSITMSVSDRKLTSHKDFESPLAEEAASVPQDSEQTLSEEQASATG